jgi:hypothetical protein
MALDYDDWCKDVVCLRCWTVPCQCSRLTRVLQHLSRWLQALVRRRHDARKIALYRKAHRR